MLIQNLSGWRRTHPNEVRAGSNCEDRRPLRHVRLAADSGSREGSRRADWREPPHPPGTGQADRRPPPLENVVAPASMWAEGAPRPPLQPPNFVALFVASLQPSHPPGAPP